MGIGARLRDRAEAERVIRAGGIRHLKGRKMYETATQSYRTEVAGPGKDRPASRIEHDVEVLKTLTGKVEHTTQRIIHHARALGYFEPPSDAKAQAPTTPTPVITTLADAIQALDRAIDHCSGSLNVFD
jgi:hypothetical protein